MSAAGKLYFTNQDGLTIVIRSGRQYQEIARYQLPPMILASPAIHHDGLLIRNSDALFLIRAK